MIRKITEQEDFEVYAELLNNAFGTVAHEFELTKENCPTNNAFITGDVLKGQLAENREFYCYEDNKQVSGFIVIESSLTKPGIFYIEKVAVDPDNRHKGIGRFLMDFATSRIIELGGTCISVGLIDANSVLKNWYRKQGYAEVGVKSYDHLPFDVCLMEKCL